MKKIIEKKEVNEKYLKKIYLNVLKAIIIVAYFLFLNLACENVNAEYFKRGIQLCTMIFLFVAIFIFEIAYRKDDDDLAIQGIEILVLSAYTLTSQHITKKFKFDFKNYSLVASYIFSIYFILKSIVVYTKGRKEMAEDLSDIREIVKKDEPIKKEATKKKKEDLEEKEELKVETKKAPAKKKTTRKKVESSEKNEELKAEIKKTPAKKKTTRKKVESSEKNEEPKAEIKKTPAKKKTTRKKVESSEKNEEPKAETKKAPAKRKQQKRKQKNRWRKAMIRSMTGYGKQSLSIEKREYQVEIKSVNHRYLDINIKMPKTLSYLEDTIKKEISEKIKRGKIDVFITFENNSQEGKNININKELAKLYIKELKELANEEKISSNIEVIDIAKFPDVLTIKADEEDEKIKQELMQVTEQAVNNIINMKKTEGNKIAQDLLQRIDKIENKIVEISSKSTGLIEEYVVKLEKRVKEILKTEEIDKSRLAQEVVIYADKCSIEEEITRLKSHIYQFKNLISNNENKAIGKKLDFIIQEMNRETNTIGSKANNLEITNGVIDIKTELEDIREQTQNIE